MPLPTIPFVMRCAIRGLTTAGHDPVINVVHVTDTTPGDESSVDGVLQPAWSNLMAPLIPSVLQWQDVTYTKLDGSASVVLPWTATQPHATSSPQGMNVAMVHSWRTPLGGRRHRGRSYAGPIGNNTIDLTAPDLFLATSTGPAATRGGAFISAMIAGGFPLVVASYVASTAEGVTRVVINPKVCTQRKRTNGR